MPIEVGVEKGRLVTNQKLSSAGGQKLFNLAEQRGNPGLQGGDFLLHGDMRGGNPIDLLQGLLNGLSGLLEHFRWCQGTGGLQGVLPLLPEMIFALPGGAQFLDLSQTQGESIQQLRSFVLVIQQCGPGLLKIF